MKKTTDRLYDWERKKLQGGKRKFQGRQKMTVNELRDKLSSMVVEGGVGEAKVWFWGDDEVKKVGDVEVVDLASGRKVVVMS